MAVILARQISDADKAIVLAQHGRRCFATGHAIPDGEAIHFDHIRAFSTGGRSELDNIAPMCSQHNREKGALPLDDFRVKLRLQEFFSLGDRLTLRDMLGFLKKHGELARFGDPVSVVDDASTVSISSPSRTIAHALYLCPTTGWKYFYATLDVDLLDSDDEDDGDKTLGLQPRYLIFDKVFDLFRHFQGHPVLQPSIGRIVSNRIRLFDGQHKIAGLLWNGRRVFECKVYLSPDVRLLNQTNISAHDRFAQTRFFSSIMVMKLGTQFGADFETYKHEESDEPKTEAGFVSFMKKGSGAPATRGQVNERFRSYLYNSVLEHADNKAKQYVAAGNRRTDEKPITIDMLSKSLFAALMYREPTSDDMATEAYRRDAELENMVLVLNLLHDLALSGWNGKAGSEDSQQRRLDRMFRSKSMMAWAEVLRDAICAKLDLHDSEQRAMPLYRELAAADRERVKAIVRRLVDWKRWDSPADDEIDRILSDNKSEVKDWFRKNGLTAGYLMGAPQ